MQREELEMQFKEKLSIEVAEHQRKNREASLHKELQFNNLERRIIEYESRA